MIIKGRMLIDGKWVDALTGETLSLCSPSTGEVIGTIPNGSVNDVELAVEAAHRSFPLWRRMDAKKRGMILIEVARRLRNRIPELALLSARDNGSPIRYLRRFVENASERLEYFGGLALEVKGQTISTPANILSYTVREPFGVVAQVIPWNAPLVIFASNVGSALVAGNTVVIKVSELAPLAELELAKIFNKLLPPGVLNVVTGYGAPVGESLVRHPLIRKISFTGSRNIGRKVMKNAADNITPVRLELGGKNPNIVFPDANLETAVKGALNGMCLYLQGQACFACTRLFLHDAIYDKFLKALLTQIKTIRIGLPTSEKTDMGALISRERLRKIMDYVHLGSTEGAHVVFGGTEPTNSSLSKGNFLVPTVFVDVANDMRIAQEDIFGPVLCVLRWSDYDEMLRQANAVNYGLVASIWTENLSLAHETARRLEVGYVWINHISKIYIGVPFGGYKQSGFGRQHSLGGLLEYTQEKSVCARLNNSDNPNFFEGVKS